MFAVQTCLANNLSNRICCNYMYSLFSLFCFPFSSENTIYYQHDDGSRISTGTRLKVAMTTNLVIVHSNHPYH